MSANTSANKRRRTTSNNNTLHISDLPVGILTDAADYLSTPSRAIFAVALSAPSTSWQTNNGDNCICQLSDMSRAILSPPSQWDTLDFEDIEKTVANQLTDDDLFTILTCINAKETLQKLKLTACINVTGRGLNPLRGSIALKQIDISLLGKHEKAERDIDPAPFISHEIALPILHSIAATGRCSLKYVVFPNMWRYSCNLESELSRFRRSYFIQRDCRCEKCMVYAQSHSTHTRNELKNNACYDCLNQYCGSCLTPRGLCYHCKKDYCVACEPTMQSCSGCHQSETWKQACSRCGESCDTCGKFWCKECPNLFRCVRCNETVCTECSPYEESFLRIIPVEEFACEGCKEGDC